MAHGFRGPRARRLELIEPFAGYAFNKRHAWCYGHIAYQTAYLKSNHPVEYLTAVLQLAGSAPDPYERIAQAVAECARLGIEVLPPDINTSGITFTVVEQEDESLAIRFGLRDIKKVGTASVEGIIRVREESGPYRDLDDFCKPRRPLGRDEPHDRAPRAGGGRSTISAIGGRCGPTATGSPTWRVASASCRRAASRRCSTCSGARWIRPCPARTDRGAGGPKRRRCAGRRSCWGYT